MKTTVNRSIIIGSLYSLMLLLFIATLIFIVFPFSTWHELWERKLFDLPFVIIVPAITLIIGALSGMFMGFYWRRQLVNLEKVVETLGQGVSFNKTSDTFYDSEFLSILDKLELVEKYIQEQTRRSQKLVNERVEDQEKRVEKVISEERNRLARELHDSVSQELFAASMLVSAMNESTQDGNLVVKKQLQQVETIIQQAQLEMRALLLHLRPVALKDKSLEQGIRQLLEELQQKVPIEITWNMESVSLSRGVEDHLFRIFQESVSNTLRHAKAHALDILLIERESNVILRVADDGVGFEEDSSQTSSYGLMNMKERAAEIGASLRVISVPNEGTRLEVRVPIIQAEGDDND